MSQQPHQVIAMFDRLRKARELVYQRFPLDWNPPSFKTVRLAAVNLLREFDWVTRILVLRDQALRVVREAVLKDGRTLLITDRYVRQVYEIPASAIGQDGVLRIDPLPVGAKPYAGHVDLVVVACMGFKTGQVRLYGDETCRDAYMLDRLYDGLPGGFKLDSATPVVCVASDLQEVNDWPDVLLSSVTAHAIITPSRFIEQDTGVVTVITPGIQQVTTEEAP